MKFTIRYSGDGEVMKWVKLSIFAIGAIIAIPMIVIALVAMLSERITRAFICWLKEFTNTDINW